MKKISFLIIFLIFSWQCGSNKKQNSDLDSLLLLRSLKSATKQTQLPHRLSNSIPLSLKKSPFQLNLSKYLFLIDPFFSSFFTLFLRLG